MKVCLVVSDFAPRVGGIAAFNTDLARSLASREEIERVVVLSFQGKVTSEEMISPKLSVRRFPRNNVFGIFFTLFTQLWGLRHFDAVHSPNVYPVGFISLLIAKYVLRLPMIITFHGTDALTHEGSVWSRWAKRFVILHGSKTTTVSHAVQEVVAKKYGVPEERFQVIYYSLPLQIVPHEREKARAHFILERDDIAVVSVGNLVKRKGFDDLIRALSLAKNPHLKLLVAGDGPERESLASLAREMSLEDRVQFLGRISDIEVLFGAADIFVLASKYLKEEGDIEGLGIVLLEAQLRKIPVMGTRSGGIPEALLDKKTGYLVNEGDVKDIAEHIDELASHKELREHMGSAGEEFVKEKFDPSRIASEYISLYESARK